MKSKKIKTIAKSNAEYHPAKTIILHTPGDELFYGCLHGIAALYEKTPFDRHCLIQEHQSYVKLLKRLKIKVLLLKDILLDGTVDAGGNPAKGQPLDNLIRFASDAFQISFPLELPSTRFSEQKKYKLETLSSFHPKDLVKILLEQPQLTLEKCNEGNSDLIVKNYSFAPLMNMHFMRDQQITTSKGIVLGRMNSTQRRAETKITKFAFSKLGITPIYEVQDNGRLEGGDFIPCGDFAFIGQGLRTNEEGIQQLLGQCVFGCSEVAVVKDSYKQQDEMHLDTYFNIIGPNKAVILEDRVDHYDFHGNFVKANQNKKINVDVYTYKQPTYTRDGSNHIFVAPGRYEKSLSDVSFQEYLESKGFKVGKDGQDNSLITLTKEEQKNYGINFLTIEPNRIIAVNGVSSDYIRKMKGIKVIPINLKNFVKTFGAPHCATQVIYRSN